MSTPPPTRPAPPGDPPRAFRDRAAVILAEERGFTPQCRVKLARIARELGLSDVQAEEAIRSLKRDARPKQASDPIVEKFRQRLRKDLSGRHRTVIGPEIEARVIESAKRKYGLDDDIVREVLSDVAAELGLRHITGDQAVQLFADVVDQAVGDATWLAREAWDRLRTSGEKWGLSFDEADELVEQKIAANRQAYAAGQFWNRFALAGSLALVAAVALGLAAFYFVNRGPNRAAGDGGKSTAVDVAPDQPEKKAPPTQPAWWDIDLAVAIATARREISDVAALYDNLRASEGATRAAAYEVLAELAVKIDPERRERPLIVDVLAGCHALDPDDACASRLRDALLKLVPGSDQKLTRSTFPYERAYRGVETALALMARPGLPAARGEALAAAISTAVAARVTTGGAQSPETRAAVLGALTKTLYRHLTAKGPAQPEEAAELQPFLTAQASQWLAPADSERLNVAFLVAMLAGAAREWKLFEPLMAGLADSRDPLIVLELLAAYRQAENRALQQSLGAMLVRRTGARPKSDDPRQVARAVRQALGASGVAVATSAEDRWEDLRATAEPALSRPTVSLSDRAALWTETMELAKLATQAMALAQGEPGFAIFDELARTEEGLIKESKEPDVAESGSPGNSFRPPPVRKRPPTLQEKQQLQRALAQLGEFESQSPVVRTNALRMVASRVPTISDLTYEQAVVVARYLLAAKEEGEIESIAGALAQLRSWRQVRLAVADRLEESKLTPSQRDQLLVALSGAAEPPVGASAAALRKWLLKDVLADIEGSAEEPFFNGGKESSPASDALAEIYRQRARLLAVPASEYQTAHSPPAALDLVVGVLGRQSEKIRGATPQESGALLAHRLEVARYLAASEPERTVLMQRILLELMVQRIKAHKPSQGSAAAKIVSELAAADASTGDLLVQLRGGERATLEMGMLYAVP